MPCVSIARCNRSQRARNAGEASSGTSTRPTDRSGRQSNAMSTMGFMVVSDEVRAIAAYVIIGAANAIETGIISRREASPTTTRRTLLFAAGPRPGSTSRRR